MVMSSKKIGRMVGADVDKALADIGSARPDMKDEGAELKAAVAPKNDLSFAEAFKANRMAGNKTFTWKGKSYTTKMAGEGAKRAAPSKPAASATPVRREAPKSETKTDTRLTKPMAATQAKTQTAAASRPKQDAGAAYERRAAEKEKLEKSSAGKNVGAKLANMLGFGSSGDRRAAQAARDMATRNAAQRKNFAPILLVGEAARKANKGTIGGMAKGGKIDGCAIRGKTRAKMK